MHYVTYLRVSTDHQGKSGLGLDAQRKAVADHIESKGEIAAEYVEIESGKKNDRPQLILPIAHLIVQPTSNSCIDPPFSKGKSISAKSCDERDPGQDGLDCPVLLPETPHQILVRSGRFGRIVQPGLQIARPSSREHLVAVDVPQCSKMLTAGFFAGRIVSQIIGTQPELRRQKARHGLGNDLTRCQQSSRIS